jgi:hypothetical protein
VRVSIVVVDERTNQPIKNASISYGNQTATTDDKGQAVLSDIPVGTVVMTVRAGGKQTQETVQVTQNLTGTQDVVFKVPTAKYTATWSLVGYGGAALLVAAVFGTVWLRRRKMGHNDDNSPVSSNDNDAPPASSVTPGPNASSGDPTGTPPQGIGAS